MPEIISAKEVVKSKALSFLRKQTSVQEMLLFSQLSLIILWVTLV